MGSNAPVRPGPIHALDELQLGMHPGELRRSWSRTRETQRTGDNDHAVNEQQPADDRQDRLTSGHSLLLGLPPGRERQSRAPLIKA